MDSDRYMRLHTVRKGDSVDLRVAVTPTGREAFSSAPVGRRQIMLRHNH